MNSENNSSCSRDSAEDPTHLSDSNFGKNETNRRRSENYKFRIADGDENAISGTTNERDELMNEAGFSEQHKTSRTKPFKVIRQPDFCFFCKTEVKNFARHIQRNHVGETEVQNILALPSNSIERKRAFACLRKKGNFIQNSTTFSKPVHRSPLKDTEENYIPCPYCLGFYSRKLLWKHKKMCSFNKNPLVGKSLSAGQNLLPCVDQTNLNLTTKVFPRMWADKVSLTAKKDSLICAFGSRYLNTHKELHRIHVCSRKMRELAKVLMESQKFDSSIKNLFDLLLPQYFDVVVQSVKVIAKYDPQKEEFESPTFAMNISKTLKDCCDIAILHIVKRKHNYLNLTASEAEAHVELFRKLLETTWKHKISIKAGNYLNKTSFNKITLVPLAADLKLFRDYLIKKGKEAAHNVKQNIKNSKAFKVLMETIFCRLLLSNRKRVGELQTMKLATYMSTEESNNSNYEEFADAVTPAEKLLKFFKRVVTRGKGGRGVPVLFSMDVQDHMKLFLQARSEFVDESNSFLFANPASKEQPLIGYKVLYKYTRLCGAVNPEALTSSKLRKHLATLNQVFNMTQNDIEQLATLMGHTVDAHKQVYRLPDDVYQTAKIAKLLMLMERGEAGNYKGKTLDEIDLKMDDDIFEEEDEENYDLKNDLEIIEGINDSGNILDEDIEASQHNIRDSSSTVNKNAENFKKRLLVPWTNQQKKVVTQFFQNHINMKKPPRRHECDNLRDKYPKLLENKSWKKIKVFIQNSYKKKT